MTAVLPDSVKKALQSVPPECHLHFLRTMKEVAAGDPRALGKWRVMPVDARTFIEDPFYLNAKGTLYPKVMQAFIDFNEGDYSEGVFTGGIGVGKSTLGIYSQGYQLYLLLCMANPQKYFGLDPNSEIMIVFQSINATIAEDGDYARFRSMVENSEFFKTQAPPNPNVTSRLEFPNRIIVAPVTGSETGTLGSNTIGGIIDEINYMKVHERSKKSDDGGSYNQAVELYNSIATRRESRFMSRGHLPGRLCLISSRRHPGQFTDIKEAEAKTNPKIYVYDKRVWEVKPNAYEGGMFRVFIGDETRRPRVLADTEVIPAEDEHLVDKVPSEYRNSFEGPTADLVKALRNICGRSAMASHPFMPNREAVAANFGKRKNLCTQDRVDFKVTRPAILPSLIKHNPQYPRWAHVDLGLTSDSAGLVIGHVSGFKTVARDAAPTVNSSAPGSEYDLMPIVEIDFVLEIAPPLGGEINFGSIRDILYKLREKGLPIKWVSFDTFQSRDSMQMLRQKNFAVGLTSTDKNTDAYMVLKTALYEGRVNLPKHPKLLKELLQLEKVAVTGKIDHPPNGSKDVSDALACVVHGLSYRREVWIQHGATISQHVLSQMTKDK